MGTAIPRAATPSSLARRWWPALTIVAGIIIGIALWFARPGAGGAPGLQEFKMPDWGRMPVAIAVGGNGSVWITMESADALGRFRNGRFEAIAKSGESIEPLGLAVDGHGNVWTTEAPQQKIGRLAVDGTTSTFSLGTPVARLGRLAAAPDGAVWFAESSLMSVTRLHEGRLQRHVAGALVTTLPVDAAPFGVAVARDGTVWATLPNVNKLLRIAPDGTAAAFDAPSRQAGLSDIAVDAAGVVYFLQLGANKIGRFNGERFEEFNVPTPNAGLTGLAVAPDGAAWFTELRGHKIGRLYRGVITEFELPRPDARPFGIAVDAANNVWYSDLSGWLGRLEADRARVR